MANADLSVYACESADRPERVLEIDFLRGATLLWLVGYNLLRPSELLPRWLHRFLEHGDAVGLRLADIGPPGFVMFSALSVSLSLDRRRQMPRGPRQSLVRLARRVLLLCAIGAALDYFLFSSPFGGRWFRLLSLIAASDFITGILFLFAGTRGVLAAWIGLLIGHAVLIAAADTFSVDSIPTHAFWLSGIASGASTAWLVPLFKQDLAPFSRAAISLLVGTLCANAAVLASSIVPIDNYDWSPSYSLLASGFAFIVLAAVILLTNLPIFAPTVRAIAFVGMNPLPALLATLVLRHVVMSAAIPSLDRMGWTQYGPAFWIACALFAIALPYFLTRMGWRLRV